MRSGATSLLSAISASVVAPIWLVEIGLSTTQRYSNGPALTYNGNSYSAQDFIVSRVTVGSTTGTITFQGIDESFTSLFRQGDAEGSTVKLWKTSVQPNYTAADTAFQITETAIDSLALNSSQITLVLNRQPVYEPNKRVDAANGFTFVTAAGVQQLPSGTTVLT